jgi:hypothetical protein
MLAAGWQCGGCAQRDGGYYTLLFSQSYFWPQYDHIQTNRSRKESIALSINDVLPNVLLVN